MSSWYWLYDLLLEEGFEGLVSNPKKTKAIASAKIKHDKVDSHMLGQLLRADLISESHVSSFETGKAKELPRHRTRLVHDTSRMKQRIDSYNVERLHESLGYQTAYEVRPLHSLPKNVT
jgi:transposase